MTTKSKSIMPTKKLSGKQTLVASPGDFMSLGSIGKLGQMLGQANQFKIPTYYYDWTCFDLPLTDAEFDAEFSSTRAVFDCGPDSNVNCGRQTNALCGSGVGAPFVATGICIYAIGEGRSFAIHGATVPAPTAAGSSAPELQSVALTTPGNLQGVVDIAASPGGVGAESATLWWGGPTHLFIEKYFQAFRLNVLMNRRFLFVDENLNDVGMCPNIPAFQGASSSQISTQPFIRAVNDTMNEKSMDRIFLTANAGPAGSPDCLPPPIAGVTYGHLEIQHLANRIYCFPQPLLFLPGMRFDIQFVPIEDAACFRALRSAVTFNCQTLAENLGSSVSGVAAAASCGTSCTVPGGRICLGVILKGYELWPSACIEYMQQYVSQGSVTAAMIAGVPYGQQLLKQGIAEGRDKGIVRDGKTHYAGNLAGIANTREPQARG
jgi:hypothetical protein